MVIAEAHADSHSAIVAHAMSSGPPTALNPALEEQAA